MAESLPISGYIDPKAFPFLLIDLHKQGATGSLKVEGGHHQKALYFRAGRILFGSSNDPRDQLGSILIESGRITEQQLEDVNKKVGPGNPLAKALSDSGIVSQRELSEAARAKVERILSDVLAYEAGSFEFEDGVLPKGAVDLKLQPERLFLAAVRRIKDRGFVLRHLDGLDVVLAETPSFQERLGEIELELGGLAPYLDGQRTLKEAASLAALDEFEAAKIGCGLIFLGLVEKGSPLVIVDSTEAAPLFVDGEEDGELGLLPPPQIPTDEEEPAPTIPFSLPEERVDSTELLPNLTFANTANDTVVLGTVPTFSLPEMSPPVAPEPPLATPTAPEPAPISAAPEPVAPVSNEPPPLKIIPPPERSKPPAKPTQTDLAALDDLLGKPTPEGPLTPIQKPGADQWKPQLAPKRGRRGGRASSLDRRLLTWVGVVLVVAIALAAAWMYWAGLLFPAPTEVATSAPPSTRPVPPSPSPESLPAEPVGAAESPSPAAVVSTQPPGVGNPPAVQPTEAPLEAPSATRSHTTASSPTGTTPAPPRPAPSPATAAPVPAAKSAADGSVAPAGHAAARSLLRSGQYPEAARAFGASLKEHRSGYSVQILVACSAQTVDKAVSNTGGDDLYILAIHYQGKDCYRLGWGLYASESAADAAARDMPAYFQRGGARPKVVRVADLLR